MEIREQVLSLIRQGDIQTLSRMARADQFESLDVSVKRAFIREAARSGQAAILRVLFEEGHVFVTDPDEEGRTILHDAVASGDLETVRYAVNVLGLDPLTGDRNGDTALDLAAELPDSRCLTWMEERTGVRLREAYRNPVIRGFHPDPSIVRVGEDYYLVNSSFVFFPGLPILHSRDLVNWETIGHAVEDLASSGLVGLPDGYGYWAPDLSYWNKKFWVVATLRRPTPPVRLQMITWATDPRGPWAPPRFLPLNGIDPSLFADDDGRRYILVNPGAILTEISDEGEIISPSEMIFFGSARIKPEGPHLLKKDGWYYLFLAEGGTGDGHMETVMRSRTLRGPYEQCPFNPILGKRNPYSPIQRSGHGKPVSTPDGRWYMVYLCSRPVDGMTLMGRETALDPITWTADGWPMVNRLNGPSCLQACPFPNMQEEETENEWVAPGMDWRTYTRFEGRTIVMSSLLYTPGRPAFLLQRQTEKMFAQLVLLDLETIEPGLACLCGFYDAHSFFAFGIRRDDEGIRLVLEEYMGDEHRDRAWPLPAQGMIILGILGNGLHREVSATFADTEITCEFTADYLCDEGVKGGKRFTGALVGLLAAGQTAVRFQNYVCEMIG